MNMKELLKHISSTSSCMALVATLLAGCAADNTEIQTNGAEQKLDIMPIVNDLNKSTRADEDALHEKTLSALDFKLFENEQQNNIDEQFYSINEGKELQVGGCDWKSEFDLSNRTYTYYAVANAKKNLKGMNAASAKVEFQEDDDIWQTYNDSNKKSFLMSCTGQYTVTNDLNQTIPFELVRAAAKIQLNLETKVPGYKATSLKWKLINYNTNTSVFDGQTAEPKIVKDDKSDPSNEVEKLADQQYSVTTYSYATFWSQEEEAPQILVTIHFSPEVEAKEEDIIKTYAIPVRDPEDKNSRFLERNHIYKINATLKNLGTNSEIHYGTPDYMTYAITKWSEGGITDVNKGQASYLIVDPSFLVMKNINIDGTSIKFFGSDFCKTKDLHAWYINKDGNKETNNVQIGNAIINDQQKKGCVRVESSAHNDVTVKYFSFTIYCGGPSKDTYNEKKILVKRYPLDFVEYVDGSFVIQTTNTNHDFTISRPSSSSQDQENIVSPAFAIAKQQYSASSWTSAQQESKKGSNMNGYEGWRLPTNEELKLIKKYQNNYQNNISQVLNGTYWTLSGKQYDTSIDNFSEGNGEALVLCVHDLTAAEVKALEEDGKE